MLLILTHENADFDAVASLLAASKLYPDAVPLLPRRINRNVNQFLNLYWDVLPFVRPEDWQRRRVEKVVIVDTQSVNSVRGMVRSPQVQVYDHHATHQQQEKWTYHVEPLGATTTMLVELLRAAGLGMSAEESTLLLLGIYEDTGSMTYATTTPRDVRAAAFLLENGAQLSVVRRFLNVALTAEQRQLSELLSASATWVDVAGHSVVVADAVAPEGFDDEISSIAHRLRDTLSPGALVVLVALHNDVQLVARSSSSYVDVSIIARAIGGGGHSRAAAAMAVGQSLASVKRKVLSLLPQAVVPMATVSQIMSHGVQTLSPDALIADASLLMQRFGYEGYPVVDDDQKRLVGLLTRRAVDRAMSHELGQLPISRIMMAGSVTVRPSDSIERVQQLMLDEGWGQVPVIEENGQEEGVSLIGVVTRTDVLNMLFKASPVTAEPDMRQLLVESFSPILWQMLLTIGETAAALNMPLYFVGGVVRDLLLRQPATDFDMVVEGDAIKLVRRLQEMHGGETRTHSRFGTGKWLVTTDVWASLAPDLEPVGAPESIDFVTARTEFYRKPTALPEIERGSIKLDLHRRDFSINTLAVRLDGSHMGELLDFYGGRRDLEQGIIRVLHSLSFIDDPTRMLRAVRLEQRLGFRIESRTAELIIDGLEMLDRVTGSRIRREIELALRDTSPAPTLQRLDELGVLQHIHPGLSWQPQMADSFVRLRELADDPIWSQLLDSESLVFPYFALWLFPLSLDIQLEAMDRLRVRKTTLDDVKSVARLVDLLGQLPPDAAPSQIASTLQPFRGRVLMVAYAALGDSNAASRIRRFYSEWRLVKTAVTGEDLRAMGLKPGPVFAVILDRLLAARLDGEVTDEIGERELLAQILVDQGIDAAERCD